LEKQAEYYRSINLELDRAQRVNIPSIIYAGSSIETLTDTQRLARILNMVQHFYLIFKFYISKFV